MLKEYLLSQEGGAAQWSGGMRGVAACSFSLPAPEGGPLRPIPVRGAPLQFEVFFCLSGRLAVQTRGGGPFVLEAPGVFLLSDSSELRFCQYGGGLGGILIAVDAKAAKGSLASACSAMGLELDTRGVKRAMAERGGCFALRGTPWAKALFGSLRLLPEEERGRYCVFKSVELLYLLCAEPQEAECIAPGRTAPHSLQEVRDFIQAHLSEKLTIERLCKRFSVSPTFLKEGFRRAYGMPVHSFLIQQRLKRARELVCTTRMPIQQIAQAVGYEGMSQFNAVFKRQFGMPPGQYRKMSETATTRPF